MDDIVHDSSAFLDVRFGAIKFVRQGESTVASVMVDIAFDEPGSDIPHAIQMEVRFSAKPEVDTVLGIIEKSRRAVIDQMTAVAGLLQAKSAEALLFGEPS